MFWGPLHTTVDEKWKTAQTTFAFSSQISLLYDTECIAYNIIPFDPHIVILKQWRTPNENEPLQNA